MQSCVSFLWGAAMPYGIRVTKKAAMYRQIRVVTRFCRAHTRLLPVLGHAIGLCPIRRGHASILWFQNNIADCIDWTAACAHTSGYMGIGILAALLAGGAGIAM